MPKSIFISYVHEDRRHRDDVKKWTDHKLLGEGVETTFVTKDVRKDGNAAIDAEIHKKIQGAAVVLVLVGNDTHDRKWIDREVELAISKNKVRIFARIPETTGAPPTKWKTQVDELIKLDPSSLKSTLEKRWPSEKEQAGG